MHLTTPRAIIKNYFKEVEFVNLTFITLHNRAGELALVTLQNTNVGILHQSETFKLHQTEVHGRSSGLTLPATCTEGDAGFGLCPFGHPLLPVNICLRNQTGSGGFISFQSTLD